MPLGHHLGDQWVHRDTEGDTEGVQGWIFIDFWWILGPSWESIFMSPAVFVVVVVCGYSFAMSVLRCVFFVGLGEEMTPGSVVGCAEKLSIHRFS